MLGSYGPYYPTVKGIEPPYLESQSLLKMNVFY